MVSLSVAWVLVTIIKQKDIPAFEFSPAIFVFTGALDLLMVIAVSLAIATGTDK